MIERQFILLFLLLFKVIRGEDTNIYVAAGDVATLPCRMASCSDLEWSYAPGYDPPIKEVKDGRVEIRSSRSGRLSVKDDCSLLIQGVTADDAGLFKCQLHDPNERVFLTVMTLTWSSWDPTKDGEGVLKCSVACWPVRECRCGRFRWRDGEDREFPKERFRQDHCESTFTVPPVDRDRNYTCQYVRNEEVRVRAWHTFDFPSVNEEGPAAPGLDRNVLIGIGAGAAVLTLALVLVAVLVKSRRNTSQDVSKAEESNSTYASITYDYKTGTPGQQKDETTEEPEAGVTYATVSVKKKKKGDDAQKQVQKEEAEGAVTYTAVRRATASARIPLD
ncbi:uncharacterized protein LOC130907246 [Corythoichthys intestinalis]|uniref:uncharacterized protein LOC130907246 n=1 Tax=Corythoichthys intestinalis TaxID=161448 RepID=UPI0025A4E7E3|nr:uncharacterized protein LOC130907246 [Corythoichthys intestinalis]